MHIPVNLTNFIVIGLSSAIFIGGMLYVMVFLSNKSVPVLSPVSRILVNVYNQIPKA